MAICISSAQIYKSFALSIWLGCCKWFLRSFMSNAFTNKPQSTHRYIFDLTSYKGQMEISYFYMNFFSEVNLLHLYSNANGLIFLCISRASNWILTFFCLYWCKAQIQMVYSVLFNRKALPYQFGLATISGFWEHLHIPRWQANQN